uniref:Putative enoyl-CoA hydratase/isomerase n=1 Tax=uncultured bacterium CBNPD1 BAC clone 2089 TaxID=417311 RepID=B1N6Q7_9BACT|nr:putative enoyl-CoA hydratase/isomerase [uncultured bacterium CBNPD1 BAC clone 2089]
MHAIGHPCEPRRRRARRACPRMWTKHSPIPAEAPVTSARRNGKFAIGLMAGVCTGQAARGGKARVSTTQCTLGFCVVFGAEMFFRALLGAPCTVDIDVARKFCAVRQDRHRGSRYLDEATVHCSVDDLAIGLVDARVVFDQSTEERDVTGEKRDFSPTKRAGDDL